MKIAFLFIAVALLSGCGKDTEPEVRVLDVGRCTVYKVSSRQVYFYASPNCAISR